MRISDPLSIDGLHWCYGYQQNVCPMLCPNCEFFPCTHMSKTTVRNIKYSPLFNREITGLTKENRKMFIAKYRDGSYAEIEVSIANPDLDLLQTVEEVYEIKKVYVPTMSLKPKPAAERSAVKGKAKPVGSRKKGSK